MDPNIKNNFKTTSEENWNQSWNGQFYHSGSAVSEQACSNRATFIESVLKHHKIIPKHILDLGCGDGTSIRHILARFPDASATLVDWSPEALRLAKSGMNDNSCRVDFVRGDANCCGQYRDIGADIILSMGVIEHFESPGQIVKNIAAILPKGGTLILMTPNLKSFIGISRRILQAQHKWTLGLQREYSVHQLNKFCVDAGLSVISASALKRPYIREDTLLTKACAMVDRVVLQHITRNVGWYSFVFAQKD